MSEAMQKVSIIPQGDAPSSQLPVQSDAVLHMIERAARDPAVDMDKMLKLMAMRDQAEATQARRAFDEAVANAKAEIPIIVKSTAGHNNKYADFAAIAKAVDPVLSKYGIRYRFRTQQTEKAISVTCVLTHKGGHAEENTLTGPVDATVGKNAIQAIGSTLTYLQRYSLVQALGLAASNDDDGRGAGAAADRITQTQADTLRDLIEANGKERAAFLKWAARSDPKVERIEDIAAAAYDSCVQAIEYKAPAK